MNINVIHNFIVFAVDGRGVVGYNDITVGESGKVWGKVVTSVDKPNSHLNTII